jgi:hypothetical protein
LAENTTEYLLLPMRVDVTRQTRADVIEPPHVINFKADDCGITATVGGSSEVDFGGKSEHYSGTAYSSELKVEGSGQVSGFVMAHAIKAGAQLSDFKSLEDGQTCSEKIDGKYQIFKKYSAVLRQ